MSTNLLIVPSHLFGIPLFGFGLILAIFVIATAAWAYFMSRRPGGQAEILGALPVLAIVAGAIIFLPRVFPEGFPVRGYGVMLVLASASGLLLAYVRMKQAGIDTDLLYSLALGLFILGIAGGRVFYVIEYWERIYAPKPLGEALWSALQYANGGLVVYGALFGATIYFVWFCYRNRLPLLAMADLVAPSLLVGLALGRIGCLLNGCCFGGVCDVPWAVTFPQQGQLAPRDPQQEEDNEERMYLNSPPYDAQLTHGDFYGMHIVDRDGKLIVNRVFEGSAAEKAGIEVDDQIVSLAGIKVKTPDNMANLLREIAGYGQPLTVKVDGKPPVTLPAVELPPRSLPVHPTQIYSAVNAGLMAWLLWSFYPYRRRDGEVLALMLTMYPVARFLLEMIRIDEASFMGTGLSISQNVSFLILAAALGLWVYLSQQPLERAFDPPNAGPTNAGSSGEPSLAT